MKANTQQGEAHTLLILYRAREREDLGREGNPNGPVLRGEEVEKVKGDVTK